MTQDRLLVGLTLDQVDSLHHLNGTMTALGDVLAQAGSDALEDHTLTWLGDAILCAGLEVRGILEQASEQALGPDATPAARTAVSRPAARPRP